MDEADVDGLAGRLGLGERQPLSLPLEERHMRGELRRGGEADLGRGEHLRALVESDDVDAVTANELARDHAGTGRHVEDALARARPNGVNQRPAPARVLAKAERSTGEVVVPRQPREELERVLLAARVGARRRRGVVGG